MTEITGLHHITAIAGGAQENLDFYAGVLGMRLVKRSVNQDDPGTYHLFYADAAGSPGADLTFFPWQRPAPGRVGHGLSTGTALAVPPDSLAYWADRLARHGVATGSVEARFGERALALTDPHGLSLALVETSDAREWAPWHRSPVPVTAQIRGLHGARLHERELAATAAFLVDVLGFTAIGEDRGWRRFGVHGGGSGRHVDVLETPDAPRGAWGTGAVHHVAWRVADEAAALAVRARVSAARRRPTPVIDRFWFRSVYFMEPGGALFELATDGPGFTVDEELATLGEQLILPPWLEARRTEIEGVLPPLRDPMAR
jgi:glyoxalase family protein